jgi:hypothetical protein
MKRVPTILTVAFTALVHLSFGQWAALGHSITATAIAGNPGGILPRNITSQAVITLSNDSTIRGNFNFNALNSIHVLIPDPNNSTEGEGRIVPNDTKGIYYLMGTEWIIGIPYDSCWLFNITPGRIKGFSRLPIGGMNYKQIRFIQKDDGIILKLNKDSLLPLVLDVPKAVQLVERKKFSMAIKVYNKKMSSGRGK